uniref:Uncharacterized protein n=1 Tax=Ciona intestinalis TaxID=7719 RepID=H2Y394_CIOIN
MKSRSSNKHAHCLLRAWGDFPSVLTSLHLLVSIWLNRQLQLVLITWFKVYLVYIY